MTVSRPSKEGRGHTQSPCPGHAADTVGHSGVRRDHRAHKLLPDSRHVSARNQFLGRPGQRLPGSVAGAGALLWSSGTLDSTAPAGGLAEADRLWRNLLSSQPLAFSIAGAVREHPEEAAVEGLERVEDLSVPSHQLGGIEKGLVSPTQCQPSATRGPTRSCLTLGAA